MAQRQGLSSKVQIGFETVYGTAVAATRVIPAVGFDLQIDEQKIESEVLNSSLAIANIYQGAHKAKLTIDHECWYESMLLFWEGLQGVASFGTHQTPTGGPAPYTYSFNAASVLSSHTIELLPGSAASGQTEDLVGAKISESVISCAAGEVMKAKTTFVGLSASTGNDPASLTLATPTPILFHELASATDEGYISSADDREILAFEMTVRNKINEDLILGSRYIKQPVRDGFADYLMRLRMSFTTTEVLAAYIANTAAAPLIRFTDGTATISFGLTNGVVRTYGRPINGPKGIEQDFVIKGSWSSGTVFIIEVVNSEATIT